MIYLFGKVFIKSNYDRSKYVLPHTTIKIRTKQIVCSKYIDVNKNKIHAYTHARNYTKKNRLFKTNIYSSVHLEPKNITTRVYDNNILHCGNK